MRDRVISFLFQDLRLKKKKKIKFQKDVNDMILLNFIQSKVNFSNNIFFSNVRLTFLL